MGSGPCLRASSLSGLGRPSHCKMPLWTRDRAPPAQISSRGDPNSHSIHKPLAGEPRLSQSSSHSLQPQSPRTHTRGGPADAHPGAKHVRGRDGRGETAHAVVMGAEASHTDLETPVVWLLMEIREEMVMRGQGAKGRQGQVRDPWSSIVSPETWALHPLRSRKEVMPITSHSLQRPEHLGALRMGRLQVCWWRQERTFQIFTSHTLK